MSNWFFQLKIKKIKHGNTQSKSTFQILFSRPIHLHNLTIPSKVIALLILEFYHFVKTVYKIIPHAQHIFIHLKVQIYRPRYNFTISGGACHVRKLTLEKRSQQNQSMKLYLMSNIFPYTSRCTFSDQDRRGCIKLQLSKKLMNFQVKCLERKLKVWSLSL